MERLSANWGWVALRGLLAVVFGVLAFVWPGITVDVLVIFFGAYALVDGAFALVGAWRASHEGRRWWAFLFEGLVGIAAGLIALFATGLAALTILYVIAAWAIVTGLLEIAAAIRLREEINNEVSLALSGLASVIFGAILLIWPAAGILALVWLIGAYAIFFGLMLLWLAFKVRAVVPGSPAPV
jgi:uncharacterized membrane protein HdeD (DUF308 family)